jgi:hypothetical protein
MTSFEVEVRRQDGDLAEIAIRADGVTLTRLMRPNDPTASDYLVAPPVQLAFWIIDHWWRLRWECLPVAGLSSDWRLSHDLSSIGGGFAWPRLTLWGEEERVGLFVQSDPVGVVGPVRYLVDSHVLFVPAKDFEQELDDFLSNALDSHVDDKADRAALRSALTSLLAERGDTALADWRRLEARLGYDPDEAPNRTMDDLATLAESYGLGGIEEAAAAAPGADAGEIVRQAIEAALASQIECDFGTALSKGPLSLLKTASGQTATLPVINGGTGADPVDHVPRYPTVRSEPPWKAAEQAANWMRIGLGVGGGPLRNKRLAELLGTRKEAFDPIPKLGVATRPYGIRLKSESSTRDRIALRSRWPQARRFEMARALGDAIWADHDKLGPLAASNTSRQKFQRAFAQSLLCPFDDLMAYMGAERPGASDVEAAARHFHVSERVVRTVLVNKGVLAQANLSGHEQASAQPHQFAEAVDGT